MTETTQKFSCGACGRKLTWKPELAGKRGKCKCGQMIQVPAQPEAEPVEDGPLDLDALAADAERATANLPPTIVEVAAPPAPSKVKSAKKSTVAPTGAAKAALVDPSAAHFDKVRDLIMPIALVVVGITLHTSFYMVHYTLASSSMASVTFGLGLMELIEGVVIAAIALGLAASFGIHFGPLKTSWYKLISVTFFCGGVSVWVTDGIAKFTGGFTRGVFGYTLVGLPTSLVIYWFAMVFLFSMENDEAAVAVPVVSCFYRVVRTWMTMTLLATFLGWGGVAASSVSVPRFGGAPTPSPQVDRIEHAKELGALEEARQYAPKTGRGFESDTYEGWYSAGAKTVWYEVGHDINGHSSPFQFVVELPQDPAARAKCYDVARKWFEDNKMGVEGRPEMIDKGEPYLEVEIPFGR